jgi:hypothetical protein
MRMMCDKVVNTAMDSRIVIREWEERWKGFGRRQADPSTEFTMVEWWMKV